MLRRVGGAPRLGGLLVGLVLAGGCAGPASLEGEGGSCFRAAECQIGLVCIMGECTRDLGDAVTMVEGPAAPEMPGPDGGAVAGAGGMAGAAGAAAAGAGGSVAGTGGVAGAGGATGAAAGGGSGGTSSADAGPDGG